jgi:hypothetical protein
LHYGSGSIKMVGLPPHNRVGRYWGTSTGVQSRFVYFREKIHNTAKVSGAGDLLKKGDAFPGHNAPKKSYSRLLKILFCVHRGPSV